MPLELSGSQAVASPRPPRSPTPVARLLHRRLPLQRTHLCSAARAFHDARTIALRCLCRLCLLHAATPLRRSTPPAPFTHHAAHSTHPVPPPCRVSPLTLLKPCRASLVLTPLRWVVKRERGRKLSLSSRSTSRPVQRGRPRGPRWCQGCQGAGFRACSFAPDQGAAQQGQR